MCGIFSFKSIKILTKGVTWADGGQNWPILALHNLWVAPLYKSRPTQFRLIILSTSLTSDQVYTRIKDLDIQSIRRGFPRINLSLISCKLEIIGMQIDCRPIMN